MADLKDRAHERSRPHTRRTGKASRLRTLLDGLAAALTAAAFAEENEPAAARGLLSVLAGAPAPGGARSRRAGRGGGAP